MRQSTAYTLVVVILTVAFVAYRYSIEHQARPEVTPASSVVSNSGAPPVVEVQQKAVQSQAVTDEVRLAPASASERLQEAEGASSGSGDEAAVEMAEDTRLSPVQAGTVQYTAPPNPGAAALGEFARHYRKRLESMPPGERDTDELSRRMQDEYNSSKSSLAEALKNSREGE